MSEMYRLGWPLGEWNIVAASASDTSSQHHNSQLPQPKMQAPQCWCRSKAAAYAAATSCCGCTTSGSAARPAKGGMDESSGAGLGFFCRMESAPNRQAAYSAYQAPPKPLAHPPSQ